MGMTMTCILQITMATTTTMTRRPCIRMKATLIKQSHYRHTFPRSIVESKRGNNVTRLDIYIAPLAGTLIRWM